MTIRLSIALVAAGLFTCSRATAQRTTYNDTITSFQKKYVATHEVVKGEDRNFLHFFKPDQRYRVNCRFQRLEDTATISIRTTGKTIPVKNFIRYGKLYFTLRGRSCTLTLYQSPALSSSATYRNYLFLPFTDATTGSSTYGAGRYIDVQTTDIIRDTYRLDFNKAYNPYCAYAEGYNCPLPPPENKLPMAVTAGEKHYTKPGH